MDQGFAIVVDVGKTLSKVTLWSRDGRCLDRQSRANVPQADGPYCALNTAGIADWLIPALARYAAEPVEAIVPVAHGAGVVGIRDGVLAFSPMDYEWAIPSDVLADYRSARDPFARTGSPALPQGLNLGAQLHYLETLGGLEGAVLLPWAQYWAWLLSGVMTSEVTSLGCHSDLWAPQAGDFSAMAKRRGWAEKFAPIVRAGDVIGTLQPGLAEVTGLSPEVRIHAGLHDSNAALLAARGFAEIADGEATVLSTGTWFVAMRSAAGEVVLGGLSEQRDCLVNVDISGRPVPSARWMGGREIELLGQRIDQPGLAGLEAVLASGAMLLPSQVAGSGPFPDAKGGWIAEPADVDTRTAAIALYAALMADVALGLIGTQGTLLIEGRFAASELFTRALATLHPDWRVLCIAGEADVSFGALRCALPELAPQASLTRVAPLDADLESYRARWRNHIAGEGKTNGNH